MSDEYVKDIIKDLKAIEFRKDYIINGNELHELQKYLENKQQEIEKLNNIINSLEIALNEYLKISKEKENGTSYSCYQTILDILNELKEKV